LGGNSITRLLIRATERKIPVKIAYVGLKNVNLHISRVAERVTQGGHNIPEGLIRERYTKSRENLIRLLPYIYELRLWDNSARANVKSIIRPIPNSILHFREGKILEMLDVEDVPTWAKPVAMAVLRQVSNQDHKNRL
jgi:predicted ABC-type ATPase